MDISLLTNGASGSANSSPTASISPAANKLVLVTVFSARGSGGNIATPSVSGCNITWTQVETRTANSANWRITLFRGLGTSPTEGVLSITFGGQTQDQGIGWIVDQISPVITSGTNGSDAVPQSTSGVATGATNTGITMNLSAFTRNGSGAYGVVATQGTNITAGSGFTLSGSATITAGKMASEFSNSPDNSVDFTWDSENDEGAGIAAEIAGHLGGFFSII